MARQKAAHIVIHGKVQGVFFRQNIAAFARELGIAGTVRNMSDGTVEVTACGDELPMTNFINYCKQGNGMSRVDAVDADEIAPFAADSFQIL